MSERSGWFKTVTADYTQLNATGYRDSSDDSEFIAMPGFLRRSTRMGGGQGEKSLKWNTVDKMVLTRYHTDSFITLMEKQALIQVLFEYNTLTTYILSVTQSEDKKIWEEIVFETVDSFLVGTDAAVQK